MEKPQTWTTTEMKSTSKWRITDVLLCYLLLNFIASKIKVNTMIVSTIKAKESRYIISNNAISTICTTSFIYKILMNLGIVVNLIGTKYFFNIVVIAGSLSSGIFKDEFSDSDLSITKSNRPNIVLI